jgi:hypothetical protein
MFAVNSNRTSLITICLAASILSACGDEAETQSPDAATADAGGLDAVAATDVRMVINGDGGGLDTTATDTSPTDTAVPETPAFVPKGIAVIHIAYGANFSSTSSVSITALDGTKVQNDCIDSGSKPAGLTTAISGDLAMPSSAMRSGEIALIDRTSAVVTFLDPANCSVKRQIKVGDFYANPHDFAWVSDDRAYVSRYEANPSPTPSQSDYDEGNDLLIVNPLTGELKGRIDLTPYALPSADGATLPRPDSMLLVGSKLYVTLQNLDDNWDRKSDGEAKGRIVIVDTSTDKVEGTIDLPGLFNCGAIAQGGKTSIAVACGGPYVLRTKKTAASGLALVDLATKAVTKNIMASQMGGPLSAFNLAVQGDRYFTIVEGDYSPTSPTADHLWTGTFNGGAPTDVAMALNAGDLGTILAHPTLPKIFVADAMDSGKKGIQVRVFNSSAAPTIVEEGPLKVGTKNKMPVRTIAWF